MTISLEADIALIHIAGGAARTTPPPGTLAQAAPRRAARGRSEDLLFLALTLHSTAAVSPARADQLAQLAAEVYFDTPGSVTAALREMAAEINDRLVDSNQRERPEAKVSGRLMAGVLRENNLFMAQSGHGQAVLVRPGRVSRLISEEAGEKPLGLTLTPFVRYQHLEVQADDLVILTTAPAPVWSEPTLGGLSGLDPAQAVDRLGVASGRDLHGLLLRIAPIGQAVRPVERGRPEGSRTSAIPGVGRTRPRRSMARSREREAGRTVERPGFLRGLEVGDWWNRARLRSREAFEQVMHSLTDLLLRLAPGLAEAPQPGSYSPATMASIAVAVPLIIVTIAAIMYFSRGRQEQFESYFAEAQVAAASAMVQSDSFEARMEWETAQQWLDMAEEYRVNEDTKMLRQQIETAIDELDMVVRLNFVPVVSGGFGSDAEVTALAATATDLYVFDETSYILYHTWATGRGYEIDREFDCLKGRDSIPGFSNLIDVLVQPEPGALGVEGVVAIDEDGSLLYCAPDREPLTGQLSPPDVGWGNLQAVDVFGGKLYVLDTEANAVYIYDAADGLFSGAAQIYFVEDVPDLTEAIDLAATQDELFILHVEGQIDRCRRVVENAPSGGLRIRVECDPNPSFQDDRDGFPASDHIPGALPVAMEYSAPPEPSLYFLDVVTEGVYYYSMRLVYQGQIRPQVPLEDRISTIAIGPPNDLFISAGEQVYYAQPSR